MLDIKYIRDNPEEVVARLEAKGFADSSRLVERIIFLHNEQTTLVAALDESRALRNATSKQVPIDKAAGKDVSETLAQMKALGDTIKSGEVTFASNESELTELLQGLPNLPDRDIPSGDKENNQVISSHGQLPTFDFTAQNHVDLCTSLGLIDYERAAKLSGSGYIMYNGMGALMEWAMLNYFLDFHRANGYEFVLVPHILEEACGFTSGQLPKFKEDVFWLEKREESTSGHRHFLLPTSETALVSLHRDEILNMADLPRKYVTYTPCFRREAGSYRSDERGMVRGHQFNKVEMVQYTTPENSDAAFEAMLASAQALMDGLGLHYRTVKLAAGDISHAMARTFDIEVYFPSQGGYKEVSSVSNAREYQARRGMMRFRREAGAKPEYLHTLNGSGLATSRIFPAICEQFQQSDGSILVPEVLQKYVGVERIVKK